MNEIRGLLDRYCPHGVEYRRLSEVVQVVSAPGKVQRGEYSFGSRYPIVDQSQNPIAGYTDDPSVVLDHSEYVVFGDHTRAIKFVDFAFAQGADGIKILRPTASTLLPRFLYFVMLTLEIPSRGYNRHWSVTKDLPVPIPPLEVQSAVVALLDLFDDLIAALEGERELRTHQLSHFRDSLMSFSTLDGTTRVALGDVGSFFGGLSGKSKADFQGSGERYVSYMNVFENIATNVEPDDLVRVGDGERQRRLKRGDILFTGSSETPDECGMSSVLTLDPPEPLYLNSFCIGYRLNDPALLDPEFSKHLFRAGSMRSQIVRTANGVTRFNVSKVRLARVEMPVPPLDEQRRIASVLDKFDALVNDPSVGLPAELEARRQQYAYYRKKLLSFEEAA